jgi:hypothetical protein
MGSPPWKRETMDSWEDEFSGELVVVENPGGIYDRDDARLRMDRVEGRFAGCGAVGQRPCIFIHTRPEMKVRDDGYWDAEVLVIVERGMTVKAAG